MERFEAHLQRKSGWYLAAASLVYFTLTAITSRQRPLWYDELFTYHIAKQPAVADVLHALASGADIHPPLDYVVRHVSMLVLGTGELAFRLPSIVAFWVMCLALRRFVGLRCGALLGMAAFLAPLNTLAYEYACEGRAYALMLSGSAVALAGWQEGAAGRPRRIVSLLQMGLGTLTAILCHYYGVLVLIPIAAGEFVRSVRRRGMDWTLSLVAVGALLAGVLLNAPFLSVQRAQLGTFWGPPSLFQAIESYGWILGPGVLALLGVLLFSAVCVSPGGTSSREKLRPAPIPGEEWAAAIALIFVPFACWLLARLGPGAFYYRYTLLTVLGVILLAAFVAHGLLASDARLRAALLAAVALAGTYQMIKAWRETAGPNPAAARQAAAQRMLPDDDRPVVEGTKTAFMEATRYAPPALQARMLYLTSPAASLRWSGTDTGQRILTAIDPFVPGRVEDYRTFVKRHPRFLLVNPRLEKDWILPQLLEDGARIGTLAVSEGGQVMEVEMPPRGSPP